MSDAAAPRELVLLTTASMRARRHPRAVLAVWAWESVLALLAAWPAASLVRAVYGDDPRGDAPLWTPGGHALLDFALHEQHGLRGVMTGASLVLVIGAVAGLVPMTALMTSIAFATRDRRAAGFIRCVTEGLRHFRRMLVLLVIASIIQALVVGVGATVGSVVEHWAHGMGEPRAEQLEILLLALFLLGASAVGVAHDLARAAVVRFDVKGVRALMLGVRTLRLAPLPLWWSWAWRALASVAPVLAVAAVAGRLGGSHGAAALVVLLVLHQSVVLARVALRASWLAKALRAVDGALRRVREPEPQRVASER